MGGLASLPLGVGGKLIDFLGHMRPDPRLEVPAPGRQISSPVGLGPRLDPEGRGVRAWARFGFGFIEVGPARNRPGAAASASLLRNVPEEALWIAEPGESLDARAIASRLTGLEGEMPMLIIRLAAGGMASPQIAADDLAMTARLFSGVAGLFSFEVSQARGWTRADWQMFWAALGSAQSEQTSQWLPVIRGDAGCDEAALPVLTAGPGIIAGVIVDGSIASGHGRLFGKPAKQPAIEQVRELRRVVGGELSIIASGGIHQPADAAEFMDAGASLVQIDTGLIYSGPGLCKRINEALLWRQAEEPGAESANVALRPAECSWFWTALLGVAMLIGSILALAIASHRVVLPYDEAFCGWTRAQMQEFNPRLLPFLSHDRMSLAGTMVSIGVLYLALSWFGLQRGLHWARIAVLVSAGTGFFSFFLFLGFGYFDPFHGFVTAVLFQLFAMGVHGKEVPRRRVDPPEWIETRAWRLAQWGQLLLVIHGAGLLGAGLIISSVGVRDVFVAEDLKYLATTIESLRSANRQLIPLVAHDRATLGGMLIAAGVVYLLASLWGLRAGARWLWHALLWSGLAAYAAAIGVHFAVGYVNVRHLLPAFAGLGLFLGGLACCFAWMRNPPASKSNETGGGPV
jgi:dihydroorotate dehydrogenase